MKSEEAGIICSSRSPRETLLLTNSLAVSSISVCLTSKLLLIAEEKSSEGKYPTNFILSSSLMQFI